MSMADDVVDDDDGMTIATVNERQNKQYLLGQLDDVLTT